MKRLHDLFQISTTKTSCLRLAWALVFVCVALPTRADLFVTVTSSASKERDGATLTNDLCKIIYSASNSIHSKNVTCLALKLPAVMSADVQRAKTSGDFRYHADVDVAEDLINISIHNWAKASASDFTSSTYTVRTDEKSTWGRALFTLFENLSLFDANQANFKFHLLRNVLADSNLIEFSEGRFRSRATGTELSFRQAYTLYETESERTKNNLRLGIELMAAMGFGAAWYYMEPDNSNDWNFDFGSGLKSKLSGEGVVFDNNNKALNIGHSFAGMVYHNIGRTNGYSAAESFLINMAASTFWELGIEYREVFSINDTVFTSVGGSIIGEALYQIVDAWDIQNSCSGRKSIAAISRYVSGMIGQKRSKKDRPCPTLSPLTEVDSRLGIGVLNRNGEASASLSLDAQVVKIPTVEGAALNLVIPNVHFARIHASTDNVAKPLEAYQLLAQVAYAAVYKQNLGPDKNGNPIGYQLTLSPASQFSIDERNHDGSDFIANVNVIGPRAHVVGYAFGTKVALTLELYKDFAMVSSYALEEYRSQNPLVGLKSTVQDYGYYYGHGHTGRALLTLENGWFRIGAEVRSSELESINGLEQYEHLITQDVRYDDRSVSQKLFVIFAPKKPVSFEVSFENLIRDGAIDSSFKRNGHERRIKGQLNIKF